MKMCLICNNNEAIFNNLFFNEKDISEFPKFSYEKVVHRNFNFPFRRYIPNNKNSFVSEVHLCSECYFKINQTYLSPFIQLSLQGHRVIKEFDSKLLINDNIPFYTYPKLALKYIIYLFFIEKNTFLKSYPHYNHLSKYILNVNGDFYLPDDFNTYIKLIKNEENSPQIESNIVGNYIDADNTKNLFMKLNFYPFSICVVLKGNINEIEDNYSCINHWDKYHIDYFDIANIKIKSIL